MDNMLASNTSSEYRFKNDDIVELINQSGEEFAPLNRLASYICDTPVSLVNLLDKNFQFTVSKFGEWNGQTIPIEETVCQFTIEENDILIINDTLQDPRTSTIKELQENSSLRFYAGVPIKSPRGKKIGAFCVIDNTPKELTKRQIQALKDLGQEVEARIALLKQQKVTQFKNKKLQKAAAFLNNSTDILWEVNSETLKILRSEGAESILELSDSKLIGVSLSDLIEEINLQHHIKQLINAKKDHSKIGVPVKINTDSGEIIWLNLTFSTYEEHLLVTGRDITKRQLIEQQLKHSLDEKEILLSEVHHRVKNNLAIISGILILEAMNWEEDTMVHKVLTQSKLRIHSMAKIHEKLYESESFTNIDLGDYITELTETIFQNMNVEDKDISLTVACDEASLNINQALPCALIINELVTNAFKYAFDEDRPGELKVTFKNQDGTINLVVSDNGPGLPEDFDTMTETSLGHRLTQQLVKQLSGNIVVDSMEPNGTRYEITFEKADKSGSSSTLNMNKYQH